MTHARTARDAWRRRAAFTCRRFTIARRRRRRATRSGRDQSIGQPAARDLPIPLDRTGEHGRPRRRHRGRRRAIRASSMSATRRAACSSPMNNGTTFEPVFETYGTRVDRRHRDPSDESEHRLRRHRRSRTTGRRRSFGDGIYKTTDGGKTFTNIGLRETQTIARIVIDPTQPRRRLRRVAGTSVRAEPRSRHLQDDRRRQDAGRRSSTSTRTPASPTSRSIRRTRNVLYAASYQRRRTRLLLQRRRPGQRAVEDRGRRPARGRQLTGGGLPAGTYGRIALDVARSNPNVVYAQIESRRCRDAEPLRRRQRGGAAAPARWRRRRRSRRRTTGATTADRGAASAAVAAARGAPADTDAHAAGARADALRHLSLGQQGADLDAR